MVLNTSCLSHPRTDTTGDRQTAPEVADKSFPLANEQLVEVAAPVVHVLFDGKDMSAWRTGVFGTDDDFEVTEEGVVLPQAAALAGMTYAAEPPTTPYLLTVEATRVFGADFFLGITFPVRDSHLTLVLGGWGGNVCGLSCIDGEDASNNDTRHLQSFPNGKSQTVIIDVSDTRVSASVNGQQIVDRAIDGASVLTLRPEVDASSPLGVASFATSTVVHRVTVTPKDVTD